MDSRQNPQQMHETFEQIAHYFALLAEPMRLKILYALCEQELPVTEVVLKVDSTQANVSRHLNMLYRAKVLTRRKDGTQVYYKVHDQKTLQLCKTVCAEFSAGILPGSGQGQRMLEAELAG